jgi:hypothetical protein
MRPHLFLNSRNTGAKKSSVVQQTTSELTFKGRGNQMGPSINRSFRVLWNPLPFQMMDGPQSFLGPGPLRLQAVCIQSTLPFYRPVEPKITRLLNSRLPSVWLHPLFLEPKSFLTTLQKQAIRVRATNPLFSRPKGNYVFRTNQWGNRMVTCKA